MNGIHILMYHQVGDFQPMKTLRANYCHYRRFARQMAFLKIGGYNVIRLDDAYRALNGEIPLPPRAVVLTFDDAYENFYEYAFPVLQKHDFPAMVYAVSGLLGKTASWLRTTSHPAPLLMSASRLRQLQTAGIDIGSHTVSHARLTEQSTERIREEVTRSKIELENVLGNRVDHFCYPYGSHDMRSVEAAAEAGYATATTCQRAIATSADDPLTLPRKAISWGNSLAGVWRIIHMKNRPKHPPIRRNLDKYGTADQLHKNDLEIRLSR